MTATAFLHSALVTLFKYKLLVLGIFLVGLVVVSVGVFLVPPTYEATSSILVKFGREYTYSPEVGDGRRTADYFDPDGIINAEIQILRSRDLAERLVSTMGIEALYPDMAAPADDESALARAVRRFQANLTVRGATASNVIHVTFRHGDRQTVADAVNLLVELFQERHLEVFSGSTATAFFEQRVADYRERLSTSENSLEEFRRQENTFSYAEQEKLLLGQRATLNGDLQDTVERLAALEGKIVFLQDQLSVVPENVQIFSEPHRNQNLDRANAQLLELQLKEKELSGKYEDHNLELQKTREGIQVIEEFLAAQQEGPEAGVRIGRNELYIELERQNLAAEAEIRADRSRLETITAQLEQVNQDLIALQRKEKELKKLRREVALNERNYKEYRQKLEDYRISSDMDREKISNLRVIQQASEALSPVLPRRGITVAAGGLLALVIGVALAFVTDHLSQSINTPENAEYRLGLPVLATVPFDMDRPERQV